MRKAEWGRGSESERKREGGGVMCEEFVMLPCKLSSGMSGKCQRWRPDGDNFKVDHNRLPIAEEEKIYTIYMYIFA